MYSAKYDDLFDLLGFTKAVMRARLLLGSDEAFVAWYHRALPENPTQENISRKIDELEMLQVELDEAWDSFGKE